MISYTFNKTAGYFNPPYLAYELFQAFPAWRGGGDIEDLMKLRSSPDKSTVIIWCPDGTSQATLQAIVDAHDSANQTTSQRTEARRQGAKSQMSGVSLLGTVTIPQAENWIDTNVNDLASAKIALKKLAAMVIALRNYVFAELEQD